MSVPPKSVGRVATNGRKQTVWSWGRNRAQRTRRTFQCVSILPSVNQSVRLAILSCRFRTVCSCPLNGRLADSFSMIEGSLGLASAKLGTALDDPGRIVRRTVVRVIATQVGGGFLSWEW
jgi:hypothetical protein